MTCLWLYAALLKTNLSWKILFKYERKKGIEIVRYLHEPSRGDFKVKIPIACGAY